MVDRSAINVVVSPDLLTAARTTKLRLPKLTVLLVLQLHAKVVHARREHAFCFSSVLMLVAAVDEDLDAGRLMRHANRAVPSVLVLPTGAMTALESHRNFFHVEWGHRVLEHRQHSDGQIRSMSSSFRFRRRHTLNAVRANFCRKASPNILALDASDKMAVV